MCALACARPAASVLMQVCTHLPRHAAAVAAMRPCPTSGAIAAAAASVHVGRQAGLLSEDGGSHGTHESPHHAQGGPPPSRAQGPQQEGFKRFGYPRSGSGEESDATWIRRLPSPDSAAPALPHDPDPAKSLTLPPALPHDQVMVMMVNHLFPPLTPSCLAV